MLVFDPPPPCDRGSTLPRAGGPTPGGLGPGSGTKRRNFFCWKLPSNRRGCDVLYPPTPAGIVSPVERNLFKGSGGPALGRGPEVRRQQPGGSPCGWGGGGALARFTKMTPFMLWSLDPPNRPLPYPVCGTFEVFCPFLCARAVSTLLPLRRLSVKYSNRILEQCGKQLIHFLLNFISVENG